jgi:hypothetical protein
MTSVDMLTARLPMLALLPVACSPIVMVVLGACLSGRDIARTIFFLRHGRAKDPAIQFCFRAAVPDLDHRVSQLRCGPVMTEKNIG